MQRSISQVEPSTSAPTAPCNRSKWAIFTYSSPQIRKVTDIFKHTDIKIAFKCDNTIAHLSKHTNRTPPTMPYDRSGIYSLSCRTCNKEYVGQTSRSLKLRCKEHERYIKHNPQSAYALHILNNKHEYGPIDKTMTLLKPVKSTTLLLPYKLFFMQSLHKAGKLISEQNPGDPHPLLQLTINPSHLLS